MSKISFYISSHGFGHATREIEVINNIPLSVEVEIITAVAPWLFEKAVRRPYAYRSMMHDLGIFQIDSIQFDVERTYREWSALMDAYPQMAKDEARRMQNGATSLIVGDISPFAVAVAAEAGLESVIIANFSWDWIFLDLLKYNPGFQQIIDAIADYYKQAGLLLRTPLSGGLDVFPNIRDIPLITRHADRSRGEARAAIGLSGSETAALLTFGGHAFQQISKETLAKYPEIAFITFDEAFGGGDNVRVLDPQKWHHPDVVQACDVVITKLGYGVVTECIASQVPFAYPPREDFGEFGIIQEQARRWVPTIPLTMDEFLGGQWDFLRNLPKSSGAAASIPLNGGEIAAKILVDHLR